MRKSDIGGLFLGICLLVFGLGVLDAMIRSHAAGQMLVPCVTNMPFDDRQQPVGKQSSDKRSLDRPAAHHRRNSRCAALAYKAALVRSLELTDLALFTEARYTRHLTQADRHAPFQDYPHAFDHFPSGSLVPRAIISSAGDSLEGSHVSNSDGFP
uniref:Uncharacterized protein n=1 Tax=Candidatus Kentrum sp. FM TaxID=2126340 RepID=A0A450TS40_9GAMM|nr:MAG: hypothetical protein BECKFM1743C_GA0114222_105903 [Candidatus Kentron sp. FM]VFJ71617.1 MAG: hypothetical protein BECKFM1743A_GA0114220_105973 [Candidatus Kentron sp. FM]VFK18958.1 MAG: hypothetical protein BECKFM1743B_GA0114221_105853 [Candidatus Kentron sp. FM]